MYYKQIICNKCANAARSCEESWHAQEFCQICCKAVCKKCFIRERACGSRVTLFVLIAMTIITAMIVIFLILENIGIDKSLFLFLRMGVNENRGSLEDRKYQAALKMCILNIRIITNL